MFGHSWFGAPYYGPSYFGPGAEAGQPGARRKLYILPDGERFYGTPQELQRYIAKLPRQVYAQPGEAKQRRKRRYAKPEPVSLVPDFDPAPAPYKLTPEDVSVARRRIDAEAAESASLKRAKANEEAAIVLLLLT